MKKVLGILRGFPGLGRVVGGVSILETLRDKYNVDIKIITYLQGKQYLDSRGYEITPDVSSLDYCSIGLLPTNQMGAYIHQIIRTFQPDMVIVDGEPLITLSLRISYPNLKIVVLLNPSDVYNPSNDKEAMDYFNHHYSMADLAIVHGTRNVPTAYLYNKLISINTILRNDIINIVNTPNNSIYCILGGGTVNAGEEFTEHSVNIALLCCETAKYLKDYNWHIICSSSNIYNKVIKTESSENIHIYEGVLDSKKIYNDASLVITRSGRNTLSELAYLGIPAISFVTGCKYRKDEQKDNVSNLNMDNIEVAELNVSPDDFACQCQSAINKNKTNNQFLPGNHRAIEEIISLLNR